VPARDGLARLLHRHAQEDGDLLWCWDAGELKAQIPLVVSNHPDFASRAENYGIPFYHLLVTKNGIINIHHSFLRPSPGSIPTAGPIIHQDVAHVTHRDTVEDLARLGREVEGRVLVRAVRWHLEDRVLVDGNRTVVFE